MGAIPPPRQSAEHKLLRSQCWEQLLNLLSGRGFSFKAEHWPSFVELVSWHHILIDVLPALAPAPLKNSQLLENSQSLKNSPALETAQGQHAFSEQQLDQLNRQNLHLRKKILGLAQFQKQLSDYFSETGIRHLFFKGVVLSHWLYGSTTVRQCRDIDVIVHPEDHNAACTRLEEIGCIRAIPRADLSQSAYRRYCSAMKDVSYLHQESAAIIELHWALKPFPEAFEFDFDQAYESRRVMEIDQTNIPVFSDLLHARYIAAHGCLSHWGRLRWLLDWQQIVQRNDIDWQELLDSTASNKEQGYIQKACMLTNKQLGLPTPKEIAELKVLSSSHYCLRKQCEAQSKAKYPIWLNRQILNLINQGNLKGRLGYLGHMCKKLLAADTLKPVLPEKLSSTALK